jgi:hypothetical protein
VRAAAARGRVGAGDVACDGLGSRAGVALEGADGSVPGAGQQHRGAGAILGLVSEQGVPALEEQRNGEWRYLEFLQVTILITAEIFMREIPGGTRARQRSRPVDLPEHRY